MVLTLQILAILTVNTRLTDKHSRPFITIRGVDGYNEAPISSKPWRSSAGAPNREFAVVGQQQPLNSFAGFARKACFLSHSPDDVLGALEGCEETLAVGTGVMSSVILIHSSKQETVTVSSTRRMVVVDLFVLRSHCS
jgi:hypothetical protein